ncbi:hypothetical protein N7528_007586 [Penicillium herquei]|nr:hypothetical protein N7528_007586 [Penicillium herquei]
MKHVKDIQALEQPLSTVTLQQQEAWGVHESAPAYQSTQLRMSFASKPHSVCPRCGGAAKGQSQMWMMEQTCQIQSALQGPAVLNSVLSVMAVNRMLISGPSPHLMAVFYHHKIEAIRMIRKSLKDTSDPVSISGDTLVAIATLSILEV